MGMDLDPKHLLAAFILSFMLTLFLIFFVFTQTVFDLLTVIVLTMLSGGMFLSFTLLFHQIFTAGYSIEVTIYEKRADSTYISKDRAKRLQSNEQGKYYYLLKGKKAKTKPIDFKYIYGGIKGQNYLHLYMPQANEFQPITLEQIKDMKLTTIPENARYWYSEQLRRNYEKWAKKFGWEKYAGIIQLIAVGFVITFMLYIFLGQMQGVVGQIGGITAGQKILLEEQIRMTQAQAAMTNAFAQVLAELRAGGYIKGDIKLPEATLPPSNLPEGVPPPPVPEI